MPEDLVTLRKQTLEFINFNPKLVALQRSDMQADGSGGVKPQLTTLTAQTFRQVTQPTGQQVFRRTIDGQEVKPEFVLICPYDADVRHGDWYYNSGVKYEIVYVRDDRRYEAWAEVAYRG